MISDIEPIGTLRRHVLGAVILDGSDDLHVIDGMPVYSAEIVNALIAENAAMKDTLGYICNRENEPEYHDCGMGCGLEDRGITDRYEAMYHGWESAMGRVYSEVIPDAMPETPATDAALAAIEARILPTNIAEIIDSGDIEAICFHSNFADRERIRMALYEFRQLREAK